MRNLLIATLLCLCIASCKKTETVEPELQLNTFTFGDDIYSATEFSQSLHWEDSTGMGISFSFLNASKPAGVYQVSNYSGGTDSTYVMVSFMHKSANGIRLYSTAEERANPKLTVSYDSDGKILISMPKIWVSGPGDSVQISAYLKEGL